MCTYKITYIAILHNSEIIDKYLTQWRVLVMVYCQNILSYVLPVTRASNIVMVNVTSWLQLVQHRHTIIGVVLITGDKDSNTHLNIRMFCFLSDITVIMVGIYWRWYQWPYYLTEENSERRSSILHATAINIFGELL